MAKQYAKILNVDWKWLFYGNKEEGNNREDVFLKDVESNMYQVSIPFIEYKNFTLKEQLKTLKQSFSIPTILLNESILSNHAQLFLSKITTNELAPFANYNDFIIIDTSYKEPSLKGIYLINNGSGSYLSIVYLADNNTPDKKVILKGSYGTVTLSLKNIKILGKVVWLSKVLH